MTTTEKKTWPVNRWIVVLLLAAVFFVAANLAPARPAVSLAGEHLTKEPLLHLPVLGDVPFTNTLLTTLIVDLIVLALAFFASRGIHADGSASTGLGNFFEAIFGAVYGLVENTVGKKWAKQVFPFVSTIILLVLTANILKLFPGMESIGLIEHVHDGHHGNEAVQILPGLSGLMAQEAEHDGYHMIPFFRSPSTDLNFTAAIAILAVITVQIFGVRANGLGYFGKFINVGRFVKMWVKKDLGPFEVINPLIDIFVGVLELISEFAKIISFSFRLLGSMFGGAVLVIVLGTLVPFTQFGLYFLELFFGVIQALVFGVLTMVFVAIATSGHGEHSESHGEVHGEAQPAHP